jgi:D-amino-acid dehydrogenase
MRVVVIGAGVVGLSCAFALVEDGHEVEIVDAAQVGLGASAGNAGWVTPTLAIPLAAPGALRTGLRSALDPRGALVIRPRLDPLWGRWLWGFARSSRPAPFRAGIAALLGLTRRTFGELDRMRDAGVAFEEHRAGLLAVARAGDGLEWFGRVFTELRALGFEGGIDPLDWDEARELEPALGPDARRAVHATIDRHVDPMTLTRGLRHHVERAGATVREGFAAVAIRRDGSLWLVHAADGRSASGQAIVVAAAAGTTRLLGDHGLRAPLIGAKGYSVTVPHASPTPRLPVYLCESKIGISPLVAGLRIAGFFELGARDGRPSATRARQLVEEATPFLGALDGSRFAEGPAGWAGFRPSTPDSLPLLGPIRGAPGLVVATGHGMLGVTLAPATGLAVAAVVRGERPDWIAPFAPERFHSSSVARSS